ncbi:MAG: hypothetical protein KF902_06290 [Phycisphaeraceae bacterium]|nr:hypothetical protein [Phycisphaeraceae bacterium]QYK48978.1 MAG: hypothetical protein KF838_03795 [Phycisphaeraceae bacterium]
MSHAQTLARIAAIGCTVALGGDAMAGIVTVTLSHELIVTNNDMVIALFEPALTTAPYPAGPILRNSLKLGFVTLPFSGTLEAGISGNALPQFPPFPYQTPALVVDGGLNQLNTEINSMRVWDTPVYSSSTGDLRPASISQTGDDGDFDIRPIPDGGSVYIGYAKSDFSMFGFMQIQRVTLTQWRLIGYEYNDSGVPVLVRNLIPSSPTVVALGMGAAAAANRKRRSL